MERTEIHELSAAYALDALGPEDLAEFEEHLAHCAECQEHVAAFQETVAELAYDVDAPAPSPALRNRVLADARREQPKVVAMPRRRWAFPVAAAAAFAAGCVALGLAFWASDLANQLDEQQTVSHRLDELVVALTDPNAERIRSRAPTASSSSTTSRPRAGCSSTASTRRRRARRTRPG